MNVERREREVEETAEAAIMCVKAIVTYTYKAVDN